MGRQRKNTEVNMGGKFSSELAAKFGSLAQANGVSIREALRRLMVQAIISRNIPGIDALELESRENMKWGAATPVYDGSKEAAESPSKAGRRVPADPAQ